MYLSMFVLVVEPAEGKLGGREPSPVGPNPDFDVTKSHTAGADHGEQGPVPRRAKTIHVKLTKKYARTMYLCL